MESKPKFLKPQKKEEPMKVEQPQEQVQPEPTEEQVVLYDGDKAYVEYNWLQQMLKSVQRIDGMRLGDDPLKTLLARLDNVSEYLKEQAKLK